MPEQAAYFHAQFRRTNPLPYLQPYTILDGVQGRGHYVGTSMGWSINNSGWWGEGEIKFYIDGDGEYPTICGTGTEDYFGGAYNFDLNGQYTTYTTPFLGMHQVLRPDGAYQSQHRQAMYRWHVMDPDQLPTGSEGDDPGAVAGARKGAICPASMTSARWPTGIRRLPAQPFPTLPDRNRLVDAAKPGRENLMTVFKGSPLGELARIRNVTTRRVSSWDRSGGNMDFLVVQPGQQVALADIAGAGCINHIWCTHACDQPDYLRRLVLRARWDGETEYSIDAPLGDFFGVGHAKTVNFSSLPLQMSPSEGRGFNCWFPMPFGTRRVLPAQRSGCAGQFLLLHRL